MERYLIVFQGDRCPETPLGDRVPKGGLSIFYRIAIKFDVVVSPNKRNIFCDIHDDRYTGGGGLWGPKNGLKWSIQHLANVQDFFVHLNFVQFLFLRGF
jgi:hypothetical protein